LLRDARLAAQLTQRELGTRLGVTQQAVAQAERWSANPTVAFIASWARACGARAEVSLKPVPARER
jgi:transcriptional regulator with XRE-family HTH domain